MKTSSFESVIFPALINHTHQALGFGFLIGNKTVKLAHLQGSLIPFIIQADYKLN